MRYIPIWIDDANLARTHKWCRHLVKRKECLYSSIAPGPDHPLVWAVATPSVTPKDAAPPVVKLLSDPDVKGQGCFEKLCFYLFPVCFSRF